MKSFFLSSLLVAFADIAAIAQPATAMLPRLRYYIALRYSRSNYEIYYPTTPNYNGIFGPQLVVGWQASSRLAVQAGFGYSQLAERMNPVYTGTTIAGTPTYGWKNEETYKHAFPVFLHYSLSPHRKVRTRFDLLGGATVLYASYLTESADYVGGQLTHQSVAQGHTTNYYLTGGFAIRYLFKRHFEGVFETTWSRNLEDVPFAVHQSVSGSPLGITSAYSLGLRYRFNLFRRKAVETPVP